MCAAHADLAFERENSVSSPSAATLTLLEGETFNSGSSVVNKSREGTDDEGEDEFKEWVAIAQSGELDFYSCYGLASGRLGWFHDYTRKLSVSLGIIIFMQGILPALVFYYFAANHEDTLYHGVEFRIIGLGLYWYAEYEMWESACDDARVALLQICSKYNLPLRYCIPLYIGEFTNAFTGFNLTICLYFIFATSKTPIDLILNSLAINFLLSIDSDMIDDPCKERTIELFQDLALDLQDADNNPSMKETKLDRFRNNTNYAVIAFFRVARLLFILLLGFLFGLSFYFQQEDNLCYALGAMKQYLPFCKTDDAD